MVDARLQPDPLSTLQYPLVPLSTLVPFSAAQTPPSAPLLPLRALCPRVPLIAPTFRTGPSSVRPEYPRVLLECPVSTL